MIIKIIFINFLHQYSYPFSMKKRKKEIEVSKLSFEFVIGFGYLNSKSSDNYLGEKSDILLVFILFISFV